MTSEPPRYVLIFHEARLIWVWTPETFRVDDPELRTPRDIVAALEAVHDVHEYGLGVDARHATVEGTMRYSEQTWLRILGDGPGVPRGRRAAFVAGSYQTFSRVRMAVPLLSVWLDVDVGLFSEAQRALRWLGVPDTFSEGQLEWTGSVLTQQPQAPPQT